MDIGVPELLIILVIVIVIFGANRLSGVGAALGSSIKEFRKATRDDDGTLSTETKVVETTKTE